MKRYKDLLAEARSRVAEIMPWELRDRLAATPVPLLVDVREADEFARVHIAGSLHVPRGVIEQACEWDFDETVPALAAGRQTPIVLVCRSGHRSLLAADVMQALGYTAVVSLQTGVRGWNDFELPLVDAAGQPVDGDLAAAWLAPPLRPDQRRPPA
jgi:rhodanese-related sulfurtransferase